MLPLFFHLIDVADFCFQVTPNLYGNLVANTAAGIAGGTGVMPGGTELQLRSKYALILHKLKFLFDLEKNK